MVGELKIKEEHEPKLFDIPGVEGVGLVSSKPKITVYVKELTPEVVKKIPDEIKGVPVVVIETGEFLALQDKDRTDKWRPAPGGVSIGHYKITAGTLGTSIIDGVSGKRVILSNNHVLANKDSKQNHRADKGDAIYQPGSYDGGSSDDTIAELERWVKLDEEGTNLVDCAIAMPLKDEDLSDDVLDIGKITGTVKSKENMDIQKSGRTTGLTTGTIRDIHWSGRVGYGNFAAYFKDQILTSSDMGAGGDSGSAVCSGNKITGLLFAGNSAGNIIACKIGNITDQLNVTFEKPTPPSPSRRGLGLLLGGAAALIVGLIIPKKKR